MSGVVSSSDTSSASGVYAASAAYGAGAYAKAQPPSDEVKKVLDSVFDKLRTAVGA